MQTEFARVQMITQQVRAWDVLDERVLDAMRRTPREFFVPERYAGLAFADTDIPLRDGTTHARAESRRTTPAGARCAPGNARAGGRLRAPGSCRRAFRPWARACAPSKFMRSSPRRRSAISSAPASGRSRWSRVTLSTWNSAADYALIAVCGALPLYDDRFARALAVGGKALRRGRRAPAAGGTVGYAHG